MIFDMHVHTTFSDGLFTPKQIIDIAFNKGINGIAITDHDTILGIKQSIEYSKNFKDFFVIPGIEFGCIHEDEEVHILGYFIDYESPNIINATQKLKEERIRRGIKMVDRINSIGMKLTLEDVKSFSKRDHFGRPHVARALIKRGYVNDIKEAFDKFLNRGKPGYVEKRTFSLVETIKLIHRANGITILAHPGILKNKNIINHCIEKGIDGLELINPKHTKEDVKFLLVIGKKNNLILTGGSDFHGQKISGEYLLGKYYIRIDDIPVMKGRI
ncbi:PHP domain-containing protein [Schnuerera sp. xch1]|uniref:PHP domain-containing protein n=1 Tax=Schnuerera sp. xch1 TaxID=2874283 RepID=UPI001CBDD258|nr:PHP domain-containing protein [Schnuerera sp. xch1]MBZ2173810.1 PHP domain-containing protein [Schnuerera sp. xch1]